MLKFNHLTRWMIVVQSYLMALCLLTIVLWNQNEEFVLETILRIWGVRNSICKTEASSMQICRQYVLVDTYSSKHMYTVNKTTTWVFRASKDSDKQRFRQTKTHNTKADSRRLFLFVHRVCFNHTLFYATGTVQGNLLNHQRLNSV